MSMSACCMTGIGNLVDCWQSWRNLHNLAKCTKSLAVSSFLLVDPFRSALSQLELRKKPFISWYSSTRLSNMTSNGSVLQCMSQHCDRRCKESTCGGAGLACWKDSSTQGADKASGKLLNGLSLLIWCHCLRAMFHSMTGQESLCFQQQMYMCNLRSAFAVLSWSLHALRHWRRHSKQQKIALPSFLTKDVVCQLAGIFKE